MMHLVGRSICSLQVLWVLGRAALWSKCLLQVVTGLMGNSAAGRGLGLDRNNHGSWDVARALGQMADGGDSERRVDFGFGIQALGSIHKHRNNM